MIRKYIFFCVFAMLVTLCGCSLGQDQSDTTSSMSIEEPVPEQEKPVEYRIDYDLRGGKNHPDNPTHYSASDLPLTIYPPKQDNAIFGGWSVEKTANFTYEDAFVHLYKSGFNYILPVGTEGDITLSSSWNDIVPQPDEDAFTEAGEPRLFDFDTLPEDDFPRGMWTVNQLIEKYGEPENIRVQCLWAYRVAIVHIEYEHMNVSSGYIKASEFSLYEEDSTNFEFKLSETEKQEKAFDIFSVSRSDKDIALPHDLKIGISTKEQVLKSYPEDAGDLYQHEYIDLVGFHYAFRDENGDMPQMYTSDVGFLDYFFDENGVLAKVEAKYWYMDM